MTNLNLLRSKMAAAGYHKFTRDLMIICGVSWTTASHKLNGKADFTQKEIAALRDALHLTGEDIISIFTN